MSGEVGCGGLSSGKCSGGGLRYESGQECSILEYVAPEPGLFPSAV